MQKTNPKTNLLCLLWKHATASVCLSPRFGFHFTLPMFPKGATVAWKLPASRFWAMFSCCQETDFWCEATHLKLAMENLRGFFVAAACRQFSACQRVSDVLRLRVFWCFTWVLLFPCFVLGFYSLVFVYGVNIYIFICSLVSLNVSELLAFSTQ